MKKTLLLSILICSYYCSAQSYTPLSDSAGIWVNEFKEYYLDVNMYPVYYNYQHTSYCTSGEDTIIGSHTYTKIDTCLGEYKGAFRDSVGYIYYVPGNDSVEYLLYAFSAQVGDTLYNVYSEDGWGNPIALQNHVVESIDSAQVGGDWRTNVYTETGATWREGIGNLRGLLSENAENISMYFVNLICQSEAGTTYFPSFGNGDCALAFTTISEDKFDFEIYPNPVSTSLTIKTESSSGIEFISVIDVQGRTIYTEEFEGGSNYTLNTEWLKVGNYIIQVTTNNQTSRQSFIKL